MAPLRRVDRLWGSAWKPFGGPVKQVGSGWARSPKDVWTVEIKDGGYYSNTLYHWDGTTWSSPSLGYYLGELYAIGGLDEKSLWAVGAPGIILRYRPDAH